jgi:hypothetical protein
MADMAVYTTDTKPRAFNLMPELLSMLKNHGELKKEEIVKNLQAFNEQHGYTERPRATGHALKYLFNEGYLSRPKHAYWAITDAGSTASIDEEWGRDITEKYEKHSVRKPARK